MLVLLQAAVEEGARRELHVGGAHVLVGAIAGLVTAACVLFHYEAMSWTSRLLPRLGLRRRPRIVALLLTMLSAHVVEVWAFAFVYWALDRRPELGALVGPVQEGALDFVYFSVVTYTTLGFGDVVPTGPLRILAGTEALVGLGLITWTASLLFLEMQRDWAEFRAGR